MIKVLKKTLQIDTAYSVNSFIYTISKLPIFKDLITKDSYKSVGLKKVVAVIGTLLSLFRMILIKLVYFSCIYYLAKLTSPTNPIPVFFHIYLFLTILGMFINNKLLTSSKKKYFSIILFQMDANQFMKANLFWNLFTSTILNSMMFLFFITIAKSSLYFYGLCLILITICSRVIGEAFNISFFLKKEYVWYTNSKLYFPVLFVLIACALSPNIGIMIPMKVLPVIGIPFFIGFVISYHYLLKIENYRWMYQRIHQMNQSMSEKNEKDYFKQAMVEVREKDKIIDEKLVEHKKGYDLFNTIFFERHKEILLRSAKKYALIVGIIYVILAFIMVRYSNYNKSIGEFLHLKLAIFVIIMYFINRGSIITQAMFYNCDHAMLRYNFYREPKIILELFKKRLGTVVKVNLIPAFVIGIGNIALLWISSYSYNWITYSTTFLFIICLSIFFSVHYLVIYYLLQPYNKDLEMKKVSYSFVTLGTYVITYWISGILVTSELLSIIGVLFVVLYVVLSLILVYKLAPRTFKLYN